MKEAHARMNEWEGVTLTHDVDIAKTLGQQNPSDFAQTRLKFWFLKLINVPTIFLNLLTDQLNL